MQIISAEKSHTTNRARYKKMTVQVEAVQQKRGKCIRIAETYLIRGHSLPLRLKK